MSEDANCAVVRGRILRHTLTRLHGSPALALVGVWPCYPGEEHETPEMIWCGDLDGQLEIPVSTGADLRHPRDDAFDIDIYVRINSQVLADPFTAFLATYDRLAEVLGVIENLLADDPTLDEMPALVDAQLTRSAQTVRPSNEGPIGWGLCTLTAHTRLS